MTAAMIALLLWALSQWGMSEAMVGTIRMGASDAYGDGAYGFTTYEDGYCQITLTRAWTASSAATQRVTALHEVGHCLIGLYHTPCLGITSAAAVFHPAITACDRSYLAPWRSYPWTWQRRVLPGIAGGQ